MQKFFSVCLILVFSLPLFAQNGNESSTGVSRERKAKAYKKLLEGQRYLWNGRSASSRLARTLANRKAKEALRSAVELNPRLAEGYTALTEVVLRTSPVDVDEAISLASIATSLDPNNFGGHRYLGRLYTVRSGIGGRRMDKDYTKKAVRAWSEVGRLDPRNAEAWAFLSNFYKASGEKQKRIEALRNWLGSAPTTDEGFFTQAIRGAKGLSPEFAAPELGDAYLANGETDKALEILARAVSDNPRDMTTIELLGRALQSTDTKKLKPVIESLRQAAFENSRKLNVLEYLASALARSGQMDAAEKVVRDSVKSLSARESARLLMALGDLFADNRDTEKALTAYNQGLSARGIDRSKRVRDRDRGFALLGVSKIIHTLQLTDRVKDAEQVIEDSRRMFSDADFALDRKKISLFRNTGRRDQALALVRDLRAKDVEDYGLIRTEAELLTDLNKVDEAAGLIMPLIEKKPGTQVNSIKYDDFSNRLFIAGLYIRAKDSSKATFHAQKAFDVAKESQSKQLADLSLANAESIAGDFEAAEKRLRAILEKTPNNPMALSNLGSLMLEQGGDLKEALGLIKRAVSIDPRNPTYLDRLGFAHFKLGELNKAETYLRRAIRYHGSSSQSFELLGDVFEKKGDLKNAQDQWKRALVVAIDPETTKRIESKLKK